MSKKGERRVLSKVPEQLILGAARQWLLRHYKQNPEFKKELKAIRNEHRALLSEIVERISHICEKQGIEDISEITEESKVEARSSVRDLPQLTLYVEQLLNLCIEWHLYYPWAVELLIFEDLEEAIGKTEELEEHIAMVLFTAITKLPPVILLPLPSYVVYFGKRKQIHKIIDTILDSLPRESFWKDIPHGLERHTKWLYANKALRMTPEQIFENPEMNPIGDYGCQADSPQIRRAIRKLDRLLGGQPRSPGRPRRQNG